MHLLAANQKCRNIEYIFSEIDSDTMGSLYIVVEYETLFNTIRKGKIKTLLIL